MTTSNAELEIYQLLQSWGIPAKLNPTGRLIPGRATIHPPETTPAILSIEPQTDTTPPHQRLANEMPGPYERIQAALDARGAKRFLPCQPNLPCWIQPGCCKTTTTYTKPIIKATLMANRVTRAHACLNPFQKNVFSGGSCGGIEGDIQVIAKNESIEGTKTTKKSCQCKGGDETTKTEKVRGSASLNMNARHTLNIAELGGGPLADFITRHDGVPPGGTVTATGHFIRKGWLEAIKAFWDKWTKGYADFDATVTAELRYSWQGKYETLTVTQQMRIRIPATNLQVEWLDCCAQTWQ